MSERKETYSLDWSMRVEIGSELDLLLRKCSPNDIPKAKIHPTSISLFVMT